MMPVSTQPVLPRMTPESQGIASDDILKFVEALENSGQEVHSLMLLRHGNVVAEGWWSPYGRDIPHTMYSLSKSFTSTAVGMAIEEGYFSVDDTVISFFPADVPDTISDYLAEMRVRHLLSMSTGHDDYTFSAMYEHPEGNWAKGFFEVPLKYTPGTHFCYNTGATYMLSEIVQRCTGLNLVEFLTPRLFEPLGIDIPVWHQSPHRVSLGGVGLNIKTEDIARFGQLYLQKGVWNGQRILSEAWIREATGYQVSNGDDPNSDWAQGYGYQFWRCRHGFYRGDGAFGQFCIVMDEYDAVLAITAAAKDMHQVMNVAWDMLLPALKSSPLPENQAAVNQLTEKLTQLKYLPLPEQGESARKRQLSSQSYKAEPNPLGIDSFSLNFTDSTATLTLQTSRGEMKITAGSGEWHHGQTLLFNDFWLDTPAPLVASGTWVDANHYQMLIRLYETPHVYTLDFECGDDRITVTSTVNVSLDKSEPQAIIGVLE